MRPTCANPCKVRTRARLLAGDCAARAHGSGTRSKKVAQLYLERFPHGTQGGLASSIRNLSPSDFRSGARSVRLASEPDVAARLYRRQGGSGTSALVSCLARQREPGIWRRSIACAEKPFSVGFEFASSGPPRNRMTLEQLDGLFKRIAASRGVAFGRPEGGARTAHSLGTLVLDRTSGQTSVAHLTAEEYDDAADSRPKSWCRTGVDFIRAANVRYPGWATAEPARPKRGPRARAFGRTTLAPHRVPGGTCGFLAVAGSANQAGYRWSEWGRIGCPLRLASATQAQNPVAAGEVTTSTHVSSAPV